MFQRRLQVSLTFVDSCYCLLFSKVILICNAGHHCLCLNGIAMKPNAMSVNARIQFVEGCINFAVQILGLDPLRI